MDSKNCKIFVIISVVFLILLGISIYINYRYYKFTNISFFTFLKNPPANVFESKSGIMGKVLTIDDKNIKVDDGKNINDIKIDSDTKFYKTHNDIISPKSEEIKIGDIAPGSQVGVIFNAKNIAERVEIIVNNIAVGKVMEITKDNIKIGDEKSNYQAKLTDKTTYYKMAVAQASTASTSQSPQEINYENIKAGDNVSLYLTNPVDSKDNTVDKVVVLETK